RIDERGRGSPRAGRGRDATPTAADPTELGVRGGASSTATLRGRRGVSPIATVGNTFLRHGFATNRGPPPGAPHLRDPLHPTCGRGRVDGADGGRGRRDQARPLPLLPRQVRALPGHRRALRRRGLLRAP